MPDQINEVSINQVSINQVLRNHVKEKLGRGEVVASMTVRLVRGVEIARIAKTAGFDSLYVDMEHSSFSLETTGQICIAALEVGITPLVRVPGVAEVSRVLDAGALGVIAPHVQSADEARCYVEAAKFPPLGQRSAAGPLPHLHFRTFPSAQADAALNDATILIMQFESEQALSNAEEIAGVDGVDLVMIGSNDLLADWGLAGQYEHPRLRDAYAKTIAALPQAWQACQRRRTRFASATCRRIRTHGRALCLDRDRSRFSSCGLHRQSQRGAQLRPRMSSIGSRIAINGTKFGRAKDGGAAQGLNRRHLILFVLFGAFGLRGDCPGGRLPVTPDPADHSISAGRQ